MGGLLFLCTGNASRSVMAEAMLHALAPDWEVASAGTHSIDGQPVSWRTRRALVDLGFDALDHRSQQAGPSELAGADVVAVFEAFQLDWVRRTHPPASAWTASLRHLAATLPPPTGGGGDLAGRLASLRLAETAFEPGDEVVDPGGGELDRYVACALEVLALTTAIVTRLGPAPTPSG